MNHTITKYNVKSHYICLVQIEIVLKFRDIASQVIFCFTTDSISLTPLQEVLPDDLFVVDVIWLFVMSVVTPPLCDVAAAHDAVSGSCEQPLPACC